MVTILGVDVGGVIIDRANDGTDTSFIWGDHLRTTAVPGTFDALKKLNEVLEGRVWVISKCGPKIQAKTREWMKHHDFHGITGIPEERLRFVRSRPEKAPVCKELGITHYVDDRYTVLRHMDSVEHWLIFNPDEREAEKARKDSRVKWMNSWDEIVKTVLN